MTTDIEKQFFDTFGIEPKREDACELADEYWDNEHLANEYGMFDNYMEAKGCPINKDGCTDNCRHAYTKEVYPQITDTHLLRLIEIIGKKPFGYMYVENCHSTNINNPRDFTIIEGDSFIDCLLTLAMNKKVLIRIKQQVQALFKEG